MGSEDRYDRYFRIDEKFRVPDFGFYLVQNNHDLFAFGPGYPKKDLTFSLQVLTMDNKLHIDTSVT